MKVKMLEDLTLEELMDTYICNKYGKDPIKCLDCESHESCPAGKRAIELLNDMTESKKQSKWEKGMHANAMKARLRAMELAKMDDPIKYLIEVEGLNTHTARERMRRYREKYPEAFGDGQTINTRHYEEKKQKRDEERKADYDAAVASDNPINYYMKKYGLSYDAAWHRWKDAQKKFEKPKTENAKEDESMDEISLEEFLNAHESGEEADDEGATEDEHSEDVPTDSIKAKYESLIRERDELLAKINWYNMAISSFETVMNIMKTDN